MWDMHGRTTEEQARKNRGRSNNGEVPAVENIATHNDGGDDVDVDGNAVVVPSPAA